MKKKNALEKTTLAAPKKPKTWVETCFQPCAYYKGHLGVYHARLCETGTASVYGKGRDLKEALTNLNASLHTTRIRINLMKLPMVGTKPWSHLVDSNVARIVYDRRRPAPWATILRRPAAIAA